MGEDRPTILMVEDNDDFRSVVALSLDKEGFKVAQASQGDQALEMLTDGFVNPDVILMDVEMPDTDGWEATRLIKDEENGWPHVPIVMLTCLNNPEQFLHSAVIGADYFLAKPCSLTDIISIVKRALAESGSATLQE